MKTSELTGAALDWAVAKAIWTQKDGAAYEIPLPAYMANYSTNWAQGGPIVEREEIGSLHEGRGVWSASTKWDDPSKVFYGKTKLVACLRSYVASKLGEEVEVPEELK